MTLFSIKTTINDHKYSILHDPLVETDGAME